MIELLLVWQCWGKIVVILSSIVAVLGFKLRHKTVQFGNMGA